MSTEELKAWLVEEHRKALTDGVTMGKLAERQTIIELIERQICFDALEDHEAMAQTREIYPDVVGRCAHHGGKCTDLLLLIAKLKKGDS